MDTQQLMQALSALTAEYLPRLVLAIVILVAGLFVTRIICRMAKSTIERRHVEASVAGFMASLIRATLTIIVIISAAGTVGIQMTSFVAIVGAAGLAVALAFQGSLSNFAGGVLILLFRPFKVGDFIETGSVMGTVVEIQILYTIMDTFDNKRVVVPNGGLANTAVTNYSVNPTRRLDLTFGISYDSSIPEAKRIIAEVIAQSERTLDEPEPMIGVMSHGDSSINLAVRVWVNRADFFPTMFELNESVKHEFDKAGITIPFPQRDIHLYKQQD